jgi:hypothetical protein
VIWITRRPTVRYPAKFGRSGQIAATSRRF